MADTAAFFANKKKKKKAFKFNANKIDAASVSSAVHVDAPALSTDGQGGIISSAPDTHLAHTDTNHSKTAAGSSTNNNEWDDEAYSRTTGKTTTGTAKSNASVALLDMKALDPKRNEQDNIAEKLRLEETKAQLNAAREGMEREAERIKQEKTEKEKNKAGGGGGGGAVAPRFANVAENVESAGGKWVPPHMRAGAGGGAGGIAGGLSRVRLGAGGGTMSQRLDVQDDNLFPELAVADSILEQQQKSQQPVYKVPKKTPVGGGANWASKANTAAKSPEKTAVGGGANWAAKKTPQQPAAQGNTPAAPTKEAEAPSPTKEPETTTAATDAPAPSPDASGATKPPVKKLAKKKKKDLSTFKPS